MTSPLTIPVGSHHFGGVAGAVAALTLHPFLDGDLPHVCERVLPSVSTIEDVLPPGATVLRSVDVRGTKIWLVEADGWRARIERNRVHGDGWVEVVARTPELASAVADEVAGRCPLPSSTDAVDVKMWHWSDHRASSLRRSVQTTPWCVVARNYPDDVRVPLERLVSVRPDPDGARVILFHGEPGTGKTSAIRSLLWEWRSWAEPHVILDGEMFMDLPAYLAEVTAQVPTEDRWVLVVLEDAGGLVDADQPFGGDLSNLLNTADGIVGMGSRALFLLTTNEPIRAVPPALVRPGRCLANIEFGAFNRGEASAWLGSADDVPFDGLTLAELYARRGSGSVITNIRESERHGVYL